MELKSQSCAICRRPPADGVKMRGDGDLSLLISCPQCGQYQLSSDDNFSGSYEWVPSLRAALSCATRQAFEVGQTLRITKANALEFATKHANTRVSDTQEQLLREIARKADRPGRGASFTFDTDFPSIDCHTAAEFEWYVDWLVNQKFAARTGAGPNAVQLTLTIDGWRQVQPLPRRGGIPGQCFVAMWFDIQ